MDFNSLRKKYEGYSDSEILEAVQAIKYPEYTLDEVKKAVGYQPPKRSFFAAANDTVIEAANAAAGFVKSAGDFVSPGNAASRFIDEKIIKPGEASQSDVVKEEKARYAQEMQQAQGIGDEVASTLGYAARNPVLTAAQAAGSFAGPGMAVKGAGAVARAAGMGASGVTGAGMAGGSVAGAAGAGGDAAGTAYELVLKAGGTEEEATAAARQASIIPAVIGGAGGLIGAERVFAGGKGPAGSLMTRALKTGAVEGIQEGVEEGVTQYEGQRAAMPYDATIDPMKGVAGAATMGAILGGGTGAGVSLLTKEQARADKFNAGMDKIATAQTVSEMVEGMQSANDPMDIAPLPTGLDAEGAIARMEAQMADDYKAIRAVGRSKFYGEQTQPVTDPLAGFNAPGEGQQATEPATQEVPQEPFNDRILTLRGHIEQSRVRQQVRDTLGPEALNDLLYYVGKADDASLPGKTSDRMLSLAEAILSRAQAQPIESRGLVGTDKKPEAPRLGANAPLTQIGLDTTPTGTIRVDAAGNAAPEVRADQISLQDRARAMREQRDGLTAQAPKPKRDFAMVGDGVMQSASWVDVKRELGLPANATQADVLYAASQQDVKSIAWSKPTGETQTIAVPQKAEAPNDQGSAAQENKGEASLPVEEATTTDGGAYEGQEEKRLLRPAPLIEAPGQGEAIVAKQTPAQTTGKPTLKERAAKLRAPKVEETATEGVRRSAADWSNEMSDLRKSKPSSIERRFGSKGPTPEQKAAYEAEVRTWNAKYRKASAEQKKALELDNAEFRAKQVQAQAQAATPAEGPGNSRATPAPLNAEQPPATPVAESQAPAPEAGDGAVARTQEGEGAAPMYASRPLTQASADAIRKWAASQGFKTTLPAADMHVTVAYSRTPMNGAAVPATADRLIAESGKRTVEPLGDGGAVVLKFDSQELQARWSTYRKAGASWDYENYTPHVTLTYDGAGVDLAGVEPFDGPIEMAAEKQEPLNVDKAADYKDAGEAPTSKEAPPKPEQPAPKTLKQRAEEMKAKPVQEKIDDFGQKLAGARKDYAATLKDAESVDIAAEPLSKSWPEPDYDKLLSGGADPYMVAFIHAARDELPTKPQKSWKLKGWVQQAELLRGIASKLLSGNVSSARVKEMLGSPQFATLERHIGSRSELYELVGHSKSLKGITFAEHQYHLYKGQSNVRKWVVEQKAKATMFSNWPRELAVADTKQEMLDQFAAKLIAEQIGNGADGKKAPNKGKFSIYRKRGQEGAFVGKKIGREYIDLKKVADVAAARKYLDENTAELESALAKYKETPFERNAENQPRVGDDHRNGAQVTPAIFSETFGFRGVQFGNYVEQDRRQSDLNQAFDGLMDLAAVLGIPPRALSLNGKLGLAFGARGKGGRNAPAAHYEPGSVVVNLTKNSGPGSLAHEWWHAADNYFGKQDGKADYGTGGVLSGDTREAMRDAFRLVKKETQQPSLRRRAFELDKRKSKPYWDTPIELSARSFESYVIAKLKDQGAANDYLANVVSKEFWDAQEALRLGFDAEPGKPVETYPYPTPDEVPAVRAAFDNFFQVVETKADDAGNVAMFNSTEGDAEGQARYDATYESEPDTSPEALARTDDLAFGVEQDARGVGAAEALPYEPRRIRDGEGINDIAAAFGTDIQWFGLKPDLLADEKKQFGFFNGAYYNNTLFLAAEGVDRPHLAVLGHELGHRLAKTNPALYKKLVDAIRPYINQDTYGANFRNESVAQGVKTTDGLREEFIGEVISDGFMEKNFWRAVGDANPSLLRRVFTMVAEMIESIRTAIGVNRRTEKYLTDFDRVMQIAGEVMGEYGLSKADIKAAMGPVAYQRVWHGSPHRFDKFSTDAIGTGEGAQAYGHGLYFAGRKEIAEHYRKTLAGAEFEYADDATRQRMKELTNFDDWIWGRLRDDAHDADFDPKKMAASLRAYAARYSGNRTEITEIAGLLDSGKLLPMKAGQLYEVDIPEDSEMLLWDKPLSEQPAKVREALAPLLQPEADRRNAERERMNAASPGRLTHPVVGKIANKVATVDDIKGRAAYEALGKKEGGDKAASDTLASLGIKGIKYLDGTSRAAGDGSYNYVIFSDEDASIAGVAFNAKDNTPTVANIQAMVDQSTAEWKNGPKGGVNVVPNSAALPLNLRAADRAGDARAWFDPKTESVYLVADRLGSVAEAEFALFHEVYGHYGMGLLFGRDYQSEMADLRAKNANVASAASMWFAKNSKPEIEARMARGMSMKDASIEVRALATEEALADMAGMNEATGVVSSLLAKLQSALRTMGLDSVANWMEARTDAEVMAVLKKARDQVKGATRPHAFRDAVPMASRASAEGAARPQGQPSRTEQTRNIQQKMRQNMADMLGSAGAKVSWWDKTVGTQYAKAEKFPELKRVFDKVQQYIEDVSTMANESADKAKSILPKLESWKDLKNFGISDDDAKAIAGPIFTGTLTDKKVYSDADLRSQYSLNDKQIGQYRDFMAAVNVSLDQAATADVLRLIGDKNPALRELALTDRDTFKRGVQEYLSTQARDAGEDAMASDGDAGAWTSLQRKVAEKYASIEKLKSEGYAPLMRFGQYKVHIANEQGETLFFGLYETRADANRMARELAQDPEFAGAVIERGVLSQEQYKLFSGLPLDSLEMFANAIGAEQSEVFQEFIKLAKNNRSAMKRLIHRKGTAGFSEDVPRVLAAFITSNARMASSGMNLPSAKEAAQDIRAGDVQDEAIKLIEAVQNPGDTAGVFRGLMFVNFIGGSIASAVVNLTQPITMTLPYLSQWGGAAKAASRLMRAGKMAASGKIDDMALRAALLRAENDGIVSPQEIHFLTSQAMGSFGSNPIAQRAAFIWSAPFSLAEQLNRRSSFIAAYLTAKESGMTDAFEFAEKAVIETQGLYNKGNAPNWARNPIGASALTFKQFSVHYLEWMGRMYRSGPEGKKAVLLAIALLMLFSGTDGLPGADDIDDLVDTLGQALGFDTNFKKSRRDFIAKELGFGDEFADIMARGASAVPGVPMDVSLRMSMGNLLPATGLLLRSNTDKSRDVLELAGPAGGLLKQYSEAAQKALAGQFGAAALGAMPVAIQNAAKGVGMWESGEARDTLGRKVMDADATDGLMKFLGFQPQAIARESEKLSMIRRSEQLAKNVEGEIVSRWARAQADGDTESVAQAREDLREWNENNPDQPIIIKGSQIMQRVRKLRQDRAQRFITTISPERRRAVEDAIQ